MLHVTGDTVIEKNVIAKGMIQSGAVTTDNLAAGSVTAEKMDVKSLSAITATIGTFQSATSGRRVVIKDSVTEVYNDNNVLVMRWGVW